MFRIYKLTLMNAAYVEIVFQLDNHFQKDRLIAQLSAIGFEGFEETTDLVKAYIISIKYDDFIENELNILFNQYNITYSKSVINDQNWNAVWEANFEPIRIRNQIGVRAYFHPPFQPPVDYDLLITPKMSFGTGHHATTHSVMEIMLSLNLQEKTVYDFGTGTGILAILAEKMGAKSVLAVDNDDWSIVNAKENCSANHCESITLRKVESAFQEAVFDLVIANVNRHIIEAQISELNAVAGPASLLLLSGLLIEDQVDIEKLAASFAWKLDSSFPLNGWVSLLFSRHC